MRIKSVIPSNHCLWASLVQKGMFMAQEVVISRILQNMSFNYLRRLPFVVCPTCDCLIPQKGLSEGLQIVGRESFLTAPSL